MIPTWLVPSVVAVFRVGLEIQIVLKPEGRLSHFRNNIINPKAPDARDVERLLLKNNFENWTFFLFPHLRPEKLMMKNKSDERLSRGVSLALAPPPVPAVASPILNGNFYFAFFRHAELMLSVDRQVGDFMRQNDSFYRQNKSESWCTAIAKWLQFLSCIYIFAELRDEPTNERKDVCRLRVLSKDVISIGCRKVFKCSRWTPLSLGCAN